MKTIKFHGEEAVMVKEMQINGFTCLTFLQRFDFGVKIITMNHCEVFGDLTVKELTVTNHELDLIDQFRHNQIDAEELGEQIKLAM